MLRVNLISWDNGVGLSRDLDLLGAALASERIEVTFTRRGRGTLRKLGRPVKVFVQTLWQRLCRRRGERRFDLNIMLEHVWPEYLDWAHRTTFIPNPEWCRPDDVARLADIDGILVKTREAARVFDGMGLQTAFIGFTSPDRMDEQVPRERNFFHLAGRSRNKGTEALLALWRQHPEWPLLTVVQNPRTARAGANAANIRHLVDYLPDDELKRLQNMHLFHLCPSETEGFGHYLVEAMSVGALALTLDAPPMSELVTPERGLLVEPSRSGAQNLATTHFFAGDAMADAIEALIRMDDADILRRRHAARAWYEDNDGRFPSRLVHAIESVAARAQRRPGPA